MLLLILMDDLGAAGGLYGKYIEKYMHHEEEVLTPPPADYEEEPKGWFYYDVSKPIKCFFIYWF